MSHVGPLSGNWGDGIPDYWCHECSAEVHVRKVGAGDGGAPAEPEATADAGVERSAGSAVGDGAVDAGALGSGGGSGGGVPVGGGLGVDGAADAEEAEFDVVCAQCDGPFVELLAGSDDEEGASAVHGDALDDDPSAFVPPVVSSSAAASAARASTTATASDVVEALRGAGDGAGLPPARPLAEVHPFIRELVQRVTGLGSDAMTRTRIHHASGAMPTVAGSTAAGSAGSAVAPDLAAALGLGPAVAGAASPRLAGAGPASSMDVLSALMQRFGVAAGGDADGADRRALLAAMLGLSDAGPGLASDPRNYATGDLQEIMDRLMALNPGAGGPPPAANDAVERLKEITITSDHVQDGADCVICFEEFSEGETVLQMPCEHSYHPECLKTWLKEHNTCPSCRHPLPTDDNDYNRRHNL